MKTRVDYTIVFYAFCCLSAWGGVCVLGLSLAPDICTLPAESGPCQAAFLRWFYNTSTERCETFTWGGCGGNENNFETEEACISDCECTRLPRVGPCDGNDVRWYYNDASGQCERFVYGGCDGNANNFKKRAACERRCGTSDCFENPNEESCGETKRRWKYKVNRNGKGKCVRFRWKGCPSHNVFKNKRFCQEQCDKDLCPVLNCDLECPFGYNTDRHGCMQCCCAVGPCPDVDCCPGYYCDTRLGVCESRCPSNQVFDLRCPNPTCDRDCTTKDNETICTEPTLARCCCPIDKPILAADGITCLSRDQCPPNAGSCPANQFFNPYCQSPSCDRNCTTKDDPTPCTLETSARCCCPTDKPILAADGITCLSRDQCPPDGGSCPANQVYDPCCEGCPARCDSFINTCPIDCMPGCCCPPDRHLLSDRDLVTCVRGRGCEVNLCDTVDCPADRYCDPDTGLCCHPEDGTCFLFPRK